MDAFNYNEIIQDMAKELELRVNGGADLHDTALSIAMGSKWFAYTTYHYKILDACKVDPAEIADEYEISFESVTAGISRTVYLCLYRDMLDACGRP